MTLPAALPSSTLSRREADLWNLALSSAIKAVERWEQDARDVQDLTDALKDLQIHCRTL